MHTKLCTSLVVLIIKLLIVLICICRARSIWERNNNLANTIGDLEKHVQTLSDDKERLKQELNDQYSQISRLKLEVFANPPSFSKDFN